MAKLGIADATRVVVYDERGGIYAARLWWILELLRPRERRADERRLDEMDR